MVEAGFAPPLLTNLVSKWRKLDVKNVKHKFLFRTFDAYIKSVHLWLII